MGSNPIAGLLDYEHLTPIGWVFQIGRFCSSSVVMRPTRHTLVSGQRFDDMATDQKVWGSSSYGCAVDNQLVTTIYRGHENIALALSLHFWVTWP